MTLTRLPSHSDYANRPNTLIRSEPVIFDVNVDSFCILYRPNNVAPHKPIQLPTNSSWAGSNAHKAIYHTSIVECR